MRLSKKRRREKSSKELRNTNFYENTNRNNLKIKKISGINKAQKRFIYLKMPYYFTKEGLDSKKQQINKQEEKIRLAQREAADAAGISYDWHDNFGYEEAQRQVDQETNTLMVLKRELKEAREINVEEQQQEVLIGTTVVFSLSNEEKEFTIGAYGETSPKIGLISYTSPLAAPLIKMGVGDRKIIDVGGKKITAEIKKIFPPSYRYTKLIKDFYDELG